MKIEVFPPYTPLVNDGALARFEAIVQPHFDVFEFGSGKSTIWFAQHCHHVVSVENNVQWFQAVRAKLDELELAADTRLVPFDASSRGQGAKEAAVEYVAVIEAFPDECFDLVFVDGQARAWCIRDARIKVKPGGWMVVDDLQFKRVKDALHLLDGWLLAGSYGGIVHGAIDGHPRRNTTGFWQKPGGRRVPRYDGI